MRVVAAAAASDREREETRWNEDEDVEAGEVKPGERAARRRRWTRKKRRDDAGRATLPLRRGRGDGEEEVGCG